MTQSLKIIGKYTFYSTNITNSVYLPNIEIIGNRAFYKTKITSFEAGNSLRFIDCYVFYNTTTLTNAIISQDASSWIMAEAKSDTPTGTTVNFSARQNVSTQLRNNTTYAKYYWYKQ